MATELKIMLLAIMNKKIEKSLEEIDINSLDLFIELFRTIVSWVKYDSYKRGKSKKPFPEKYASYLRPLQKRFHENKEKQKKGTKKLVAQLLRVYIKPIYAKRIGDSLRQEACKNVFPGKNYEEINEQSKEEAVIEFYASLLYQNHLIDKTESEIHEAMKNSFIRSSSAKNSNVEYKKESVLNNKGKGRGPDEYSYSVIGSLFDIGALTKTRDYLKEKEQNSDELPCPVALICYPKTPKGSIPRPFAHAEPIEYSDYEKELLDSMQEILNEMKSQRCLTSTNKLGERLVDHTLKKHNLN